MAILKKICGKLLQFLLFEKIPEFAAEMYIQLAKGAKTQFYKAVAKEITERIKTRRDVRNLLDVGTGPGFMLFEIAKLRPDLTLVGVDLSEKLIKFAEEERARRGCHNVFFLKDDANNLTEFSEADCDFVISSGVLHSLKNPALAIKEWLRVLKPGHDLWIYDPTVLVDDDNSAAIKQALKEMGKCLKSRKDRLLFRIMRWISDLPPKPMSIDNIIEILKKADIIDPDKRRSFSIENRKDHLKIEIIKE